MRFGWAIGFAATGAFAGLTMASALVAAVFDYQAALGRPLFSIAGMGFYAPWAVLDWSARWGDLYPRPFLAAGCVAGLGLMSAALFALSAPRARRLKPFGAHAWARFEDIDRAGLFAPHGAVLGKFDGELLAYEGEGHQLLIGASRSGKGRGHVVPTILSWNGSALILDVKGELDRGDRRHGFPGTSGYRATLGPVLRFAPADLNSAAFNPLLCVRRGANEVRDVQNIVDTLVEPHGETRGGEQFWNRTAKSIIAGLILHVLYTEPEERKTLAVVREKLSNLDATCEEMRRTLHRRDPEGQSPQVHPEVLHAAQSYLAGEERLRSSIKATAESFFGVFADPIVAENTSRSDFVIADLMCAERPVTLYVQPPPSDAQRLMPLLRLVIAEAARALMESQTYAAGRPKRHRLILILDEFPQLGRLDLFEKMMGAMAGYGLKAYLVCQSLNHIIRAYGRDNVILDNCALVTAFAAADPETAKHVAAMAGEVWEVRPQESEQQPRGFLRKKGAITYREERRPLLLPADVRALGADEELIFAAGVKPIRARKLKFDCEPVFAARLLPAAPAGRPLASAHDWTGVRAHGLLPAERRSVSSARLQRPSPVRTRSGDAAQAELFEHAPRAPQGQGAPKLSELALAGFRAAPHAPPGQNLSEPARGPSRATGI